METFHFDSNLVFVVFFICIVHIAAATILFIKYKRRLDKLSKEVTNIQNSFVNFLLELEAKNMRLKNQNTKLKGGNKELTKSKKPTKKTL